MNPTSQNDKIYMLLHIHSNLVSAASLPDGVRPYSVGGYLAEIEKLVMEEIKNYDVTSTQP